jgi:hypothetical protein
MAGLPCDRVDTVFYVLDGKVGWAGLVMDWGIFFGIGQDYLK